MEQDGGAAPPPDIRLEPFPVAHPYHAPRIDPERYQAVIPPCVAQAPRVPGAPEAMSRRGVHLVDPEAGLPVWSALQATEKLPPST